MAGVEDEGENATFTEPEAFFRWWEQRCREPSMMSCNYNGWSDMPEGEREDLEAFEASQALQNRCAPGLLVVSRPEPCPVPQLHPVTPPAIPASKAA